SLPPALEAVGMHGQLGLRLHQVFSDAGLLGPQMWIHAALGCEPDWPGWEYLDAQVQLVRNHPMVRAVTARVGEEPPSALELTSVVTRIREQVLQQGGMLRLQRAVQAWARKSESSSP
ncbi:MAG: hypothetical protein J2P17_25940, partial [Mycobacterium sp.]|nr:hypothetical protein [Mycobacterium sp.]